MKADRSPDKLGTRIHSLHDRWRSIPYVVATIPLTHEAVFLILPSRKRKFLSERRVCGRSEDLTGELCSGKIGNICPEMDLKRHSKYRLQTGDERRHRP